MIFILLSDFLIYKCTSRRNAQVEAGFHLLGGANIPPQNLLSSPQIFLLNKYLIYTFFTLSSAVLYCISKAWALTKIHSQKLSCCGRRGIPLAMAYPPPKKKKKLNPRWNPAKYYVSTDSRTTWALWVWLSQISTYITKCILSLCSRAIIFGEWSKCVYNAWGYQAS